MCGRGEDSDIVFGSVSHLGWTWLDYVNKLPKYLLQQFPHYFILF